MKRAYATEIVRKLRENGHETYFVGGCVRDMEMGVEPSDYDVATAARPDEVMALFPRTEPIGVQFGVVLVIHKGCPFEVATFRSDDAYVDGRRPTRVTFTGPREDVLRRDFTINGLLYDPIEDRVIDYVDGRADIRRGVVRAIGDARERFTEDKLRILRAVRFGARLGYVIEPSTWDAVRSMAAQITSVSAERIHEEVTRILVEGGAARGFDMLADSGLLGEIFPELRWDDHLRASVAALGRGVAPDFAYGVLWHECSPEEAASGAAGLRMSNAHRDHVVALVANQPRFASVGSMPVAALKRFLRQPRFDDHLALHRIHVAAAGESDEAARLVDRRLTEWSEEDLQPRPLISGTDLITLGLAPGPSFRTILDAVEDAQLEGRLSDRDEAFRFVRERFV
jgi:poly(A) polymerase